MVNSFYGSWWSFCFGEIGAEFLARRLTLSEQFSRAANKWIQIWGETVARLRALTAARYQ